MTREKSRMNIVVLGYSVFILTAIVCVFGSVFVNSYESKLSYDIQTVENEMTTLSTDIDGLDIEISRKTEISVLKPVVEAQGYTYGGDKIAYIVGDE